ncbi:MAG TPA: SDR family NAD(P)-dependent oxidoreductase [Marinobacterium sp.]|nr:SDR family NAD(P)-dependent oxidoreductase [Marinobacterium sp.]
MERIWITGGGTGIGRELALAYAQRGSRVWISGRRLEVLQEVANEARGYSGEVHCAPLDVTDSSACEQVWSTILDESGGVERVILNAGDHREMPVEAFSQQTMEHLINVNLFGVTRLIEQVLPWMLQQGGQLAIVASLAGYRGLPLAAAYGASKAALINMTEAMRAELEGGPVDLRLINPGFVRTPLTDRNQFEMPSLIDADVAAQRIISGLDGKCFEIRFPTMFAATLRLLSMLPYRLYFALIRKITSK